VHSNAEYHGSYASERVAIQASQPLMKHLHRPRLLDVYEENSENECITYLVTGSADGLGKMAAQFLINQGYQVVLHARNKMRANEALAAVSGAEKVAVGDVASIARTREVAEQVNQLGSFDAVIHNVGVGYRELAAFRLKTVSLTFLP